jgi:hypothetical protein
MRERSLEIPSLDELRRVFGEDRADGNAGRGEARDGGDESDNDIDND